MGKKSKGTKPQQEEPAPKDLGQSMEFEVVPDEQESPEDDAWYTSTGKLGAKVDHVPVTRSQAKKEKTSEVIVEGELPNNSDTAAKKKAKKEKQAEATKKAAEEAEKKAKEQVFYIVNKGQS